jgi:hypothetical protein
MKLRLLFVVILAAAGCMEGPILPDQPSSKSTAAKSPATIQRPETHRDPVTPDQVTESNAYQKAEALEMELSIEQTDIAQKP